MGTRSALVTHTSKSNIGNNNSLIYLDQCSGSGSTCFLNSRIRIHQSEVWIRTQISDENRSPGPHPDPDPNPDSLVRGMDPRIQIRIRIHTKMSWIQNTDLDTLYCWRALLKRYLDGHGYVVLPEEEHVTPEVLILVALKQEKKY
jgi:hypothetical protein